MSRLFYLTKNYLKLIFRAKAVIIVTVIGCLIVIAALQNSFHTLLDSVDRDTSFTVGYEMEDDSKYKPVESILVKGFEDEGITVRKYESQDPEKLIKSGDVDVYIDFGGDSYSLTGNSKSQIDTRVVQYVLYNVDHALNGDTGSVDVEVGSYEPGEVADAGVYYGIVQTMYFISLSSVFLCMIYMAERKNNIGLRFKSSSSEGAHVYLAKLLACSITTVFSLVIVTGSIVVSLFDIPIPHPGLTIGVVLLTTVAYISMGMLFFIIFNNVAASVGLLFTVLTFLGFPGGDFETYMYSSYSENIKLMSPNYYVNRTLVELSVNGQSDYLMPCIKVLLLMTVVSVVLGIVITSKKKEV